VVAVRGGVVVARANSFSFDYPNRKPLATMILFLFYYEDDDNNDNDTRDGNPRCASSCMGVSLGRLDGSMT
jgi:hypothetical protein